MNFFTNKLSMISAAIFFASTLGHAMPPKLDKSPEKEPSAKASAASSNSLAELLFEKQRSAENLTLFQQSMPLAKRTQLYEHILSRETSPRVYRLSDHAEASLTLLQEDPSSVAMDSLTLFEHYIESSAPEKTTWGKIPGSCVYLCNDKLPRIRASITGASRTSWDSFSGNLLNLLQLALLDIHPSQKAACWLTEEQLSAGTPLSGERRHQLEQRLRPYALFFQNIEEAKCVLTHWKSLETSASHQETVNGRLRSLLSIESDGLSHAHNLLSCLFAYHIQKNNEAESLLVNKLCDKVLKREVMNFRHRVDLFGEFLSYFKKNSSSSTGCLALDQMLDISQQLDDLGSRFAKIEIPDHNFEEKIEIKLMFIEAMTIEKKLNQFILEKVMAKLLPSRSSLKAPNIQKKPNTPALPFGTTSDSKDPETSPASSPEERMSQKPTQGAAPFDEKTDPILSSTTSASTKEHTPPLHSSKMAAASAPVLWKPWEPTISSEQEKAEKLRRHLEKRQAREASQAGPAAADQCQLAPEENPEPAYAAAAALVAPQEDILPPLDSLCELTKTQRKVDEAITMGTWDFTRDEWTTYLGGLGFSFKEGGGSHTTATYKSEITFRSNTQKTLTISLKELGIDRPSFTTPGPWGQNVRAYLRPQILNFRTQVIRILQAARDRFEELQEPQDEPTV